MSTASPGESSPRRRRPPIATVRYAPGAAESTRRRWFVRFGSAMSMFGTAIGFGNIWRFPTVMAGNGGGAFVVAYLTCSIFVTFPSISFECLIGQVTRGYPSDAGELLGSKRLGSILTATSLPLFGLLLFYPNLVSWAALYLVLSYSQPWYRADDPENLAMAEFRLQIFESESFVSWPLFLSLVTTCCCGFIVTAKGLKWFTAFMTLAVPLIFLGLSTITIWSLNLQHSLAGLKTLFYPDWASLLGAECWRRAITQSLFSTGVGVYVNFILPSTHDVREPVLRTAVSVIVADTTVALLASVFIYSLAGEICGGDPLRIQELVETSGPTFVFESLAGGISKAFEHAGCSAAVQFWLWSLLVLMGFSTYVTFIHVLTEVICSRRHVWLRREFVSGLLSISILALAPLSCSRFSITYLNALDTVNSQIIVPLSFFTALTTVMYLLERKWLADRVGPNFIYMALGSLVIWPFLGSVLYNFIPSQSARSAGWIVMGVVAPIVGVVVAALLSLGWARRKKDLLPALRGRFGIGVSRWLEFQSFPSSSADFVSLSCRLVVPGIMAGIWFDQLFSDSTFALFDSWLGVFSIYFLLFPVALLFICVRPEGISWMLSKQPNPVYWEQLYPSGDLSRAHKFDTSSPLQSDTSSHVTKFDSEL